MVPAVRFSLIAFPQATFSSVWTVNRVYTSEIFSRMNCEAYRGNAPFPNFVSRFIEPEEKPRFLRRSFRVSTAREAYSGGELSFQNVTSSLLRLQGKMK